MFHTYIKTSNIISIYWICYEEQTSSEQPAWHVGCERTFSNLDSGLPVSRKGFLQSKQWFLLFV